MKLKGLIATAAMSLLMGVGVFAGVKASRSEAKVEKAEAAQSTVTNGNKRVNILKFVDDNDWVFDANAKIAIRYGLSDSVGAFNFAADSDIGSAGKDSQGMRKLGRQVDDKDIYFATKELPSNFSTTWHDIKVIRHDPNDTSYADDKCWNQQALHWDNNTWIEAANTFYYNGNKLEAWGNYYKVAFHTGLDLENVAYDLVYANNYNPSSPSAIPNYTFEGWYKDSGFQTKFNTSGETLTGDINLYAHYVESDVNPTSDGYYLVGDAAFVSEMGKTGPAWYWKSSTRMDDATGGNKASYTITLTQTVVFKARYYSASNNYWVQNTEKSESATEHGVTFDGDGNYVAPAGTYTLYVFVKNNQDTSSLTWGIPLDAYCTAFMDETGKVCAGSATPEDKLLTVWQRMDTNFDLLSQEDQATLLNADADEGGSTVEQVMARYDVIVKNHPTFDDFMGRKENAHYSYGAAKVIGNSGDMSSTSTTGIAIIASAGAIAAAGGFFFLKKKKSLM